MPKLYLSKLQDSSARVNTNAKLHPIQSDDVQNDEIVHQHQGPREAMGHHLEAKA